MTEINTQRYPLAWPTGWKRTAPNERQAAKFHVYTLDHGPGRPLKRELTLSEALSGLMTELGRLGASSEVLSTNVVLRLDGLPRGGQAAPEDPGAAVYFTLKAKARCLACDRWTRIADNIAAIAAHVSAIRAVDRYGVGTMEQAFAGYAQLQASTEEWWIVLGVRRAAALSEVEEAYRNLARKHHPDVGGDPSQMARLNQARQNARDELGSP